MTTTATMRWWGYSQDYQTVDILLCSHNNVINQPAGDGGKKRTTNNKAADENDDHTQHGDIFCWLIVLWS
jgi:hypothetical protein